MKKRSYWNYAEKKGYSGTAIYTRRHPLSVSYGIGIEEHDREGRVITLEMDNFYLVTCYTPNSQDGLKRLDYRMKWEDDFLAYLMRLDAVKPVIVCGDLNVAHEEIDLKNPKTNRKNAGFTDEEREKMTTLLSKGFIDTFRFLYPEQETYSWWSYRFRAREKNAGWRIDYFLISSRLKEVLKDASIRAPTCRMTVTAVYSTPYLFIIAVSLFHRYKKNIIQGRAFGKDIKVHLLWYSVDMPMLVPLPDIMPVSALDDRLVFLIMRNE